MSVLQRFTVEYLLNTKDELLDSNLFDIIAKFMYQGVYRGVPYYNTFPFQEYIAFDPDIIDNRSLLEAFYPDYTWIDKRVMLRYIAIGRNKNNKKYAGIILESLSFAHLICPKNEKDLHENIDRLLSSFREIEPVDAFDFFEKIEQLN
jgi:hypothetical protein